jgi:S-disulfanyl-L-cysteine oxidoreductase SoxD
VLLSGPPAYLLLAASALVLTCAGSTLTAGQAAGRTAWDGVYTEAQAARATAIFSDKCAECHVLAATGDGPLAGERFWEGYSQRSVGDLLTFVSVNMPNGNGGSLSASSYNDLVALILKANGFPAGSTELGPEAVANVRIVPRSGSTELPANTLARVVGCLTRSGSDWVLTNATAPVRIEKPGAVPEDAARPLGTGSMTLKFVLTRLDSFVGQRMSATGILLGTGGADGLNVSTVNRVAQACP